MVGIAPSRILQVCSSLAWGGTEMHVPLLSHELLDRGHDVHIVLHPDGAISEEVSRLNIPSTSIEIGRYVDPL